MAEGRRFAFSAPQWQAVTMFLRLTVSSGTAAVCVRTVKADVMVNCARIGFKP
jgi:hypothetical protein